MNNYTQFMNHFAPDLYFQDKNWNASFIVDPHNTHGNAEKNGRQKWKCHESLKCWNMFITPS